MLTGVTVTDYSQLEGIKPKMRENKLKSDVNWHEAFKQKRTKQMGIKQVLGVYHCFPYHYSNLFIFPQMALFVRCDWANSHNVTYNKTHFYLHLTYCPDNGTHLVPKHEANYATKKSICKEHIINVWICLFRFDFIYSTSCSFHNVRFG
jgi:hypothetical protein